MISFWLSVFFVFSVMKILPVHSNKPAKVYYNLHVFPYKVKGKLVSLNYSSLRNDQKIFTCYFSPRKMFAFISFFCILKEIPPLTLSYLLPALSF